MLNHVRSLALIGLLAAVTTPVWGQALAPGDLLDGRTQHDLAADWWKLTLTLPVGSDPDLAHNSLNPGLEISGKQGYLGSLTGSSNIFFLFGSFGSVNGQGLAPVTRTLTIGEGKSLFFPIVNVYADPTVLITTPLTVPTLYTPDQLLQSAFGVDYIQSFDAATLFTEVDGTSIGGLNAYRQTHGGAGISITYQNQDNINGVQGADNTLGTGVFPSTVVTGADGYYIALNPLSLGSHTLHFGGTVPLVDPNGNPVFTFTEDVTYNLTVVPEPGSMALLCGAGFFGAALWRRHRRRDSVQCALD